MQIIINQTALTDAEIQNLQQQYGVQLVPGRYWYDRLCGAWGQEGGPAAGFVMPGIAAGGPLRADASAGTTGVFINGRQLHYLDVTALQRFIPVLPGRYWVDAAWNCGYEGGPPLFNLAHVMRMSGASGGGAWSHTTSMFTDSTAVGGDGEGFMYVSGKDSSGTSYTYFPT